MSKPMVQGHCYYLSQSSVDGNRTCTKTSQVPRSPLIVIWPLFDSHMTIRPFSSTIALLDERTVNPLAMMSAVLLFGESCPHRIVLLSSLGEAMRSNIFRALVVLILCGSVFLTDAQVPMKPLTARELIALVSGGALSEDISHEIESRGLVFRSSDSYREQIVTAGADTTVLTALKNAKISSSADASGDTQDQSLQHLAVAGNSIKRKQYTGAATELVASLQADNSPEAGFVMGWLLYQQERWTEASQMYAEVLRQDPEFIAAHTKLSYVLHHLDNPDEALREAKTALASSPQSAEAHRNAGVALDDLRKSTAAEQE